MKCESLAPKILVDESEWKLYSYSCECTCSKSCMKYWKSSEGAHRVGVGPAKWCGLAWPS